MPDSIFAVAVLLVAIAPGFLFLQGYSRGRSQSSSPDIFVLAKAALASLIFVSLVWITPGFLFVESGSTVIDWVRDKKFDEHRDYFLALAWPVFLAAFAVGLLLGWAVDRLGRWETGVRGWIGAFLRWANFYRRPTVWGSLLEKELVNPKLLVVDLIEGGTVIGIFAGASTISSDLTEIYLSETYTVEASSGALVPQNRAMYLKGENVRTISIAPL